jgi:signal transduction histidine kinase/CheY-like chemotaxis protein
VSSPAAPLPDPALAWRHALLRGVFRLLVPALPLCCAAELVLLSPPPERIAAYAAAWLVALVGAFRVRDPRWLRPLAAAVVTALVAAVALQPFAGRPLGAPGLVAISAAACLAGLFLGGRGALLATLAVEVGVLAAAILLVRAGGLPPLAASPVDDVGHRWEAVLLPELVVAWLLLATPVDVVLRRYRQGVRLLDDRLRAVKRREAEREAAEAARAAAEDDARRGEELALLGRVTSGLAHDLANALAVVMSWAELARDAAPDDVEGRRAASEGIAEGAARAGWLARRFAALERPADPEPPERVDLARLAAELVRSGRWLLPPAWELRGARAEPSPVLARPAQVEQVLRSFVLNARDAMPGGGAIAVEAAQAAPAEAEGLAPGAYTAVRVRDTGAGMDAATRARLFEPFFSTKPPGSALGLALSTAHAIALEHGGRIHVESAPGTGSTFSLVLPLANEPADSPVPTPGPAGRLEGRVLLVAHPELLRRALAGVLRGAGLTVVESASFEGGAAAAGLGTLDLLVLDPALPDVPGHHLVDAFRTFQPGRPVLLCAGAIDDGALAAQLDAGACALLRKPFDAAALLAAVAPLLERGRADPRGP